MINKDKQLIAKLRRRISILLFLILILIYWVRQEYLDWDFYYSETESLNYEIAEKDSVIKNLQYKIDSLKTKNHKEIETPKIKINTKKVETKKDTILPKIIEQVPDHITEDTSDTLR